MWKRFSNEHVFCHRGADVGKMCAMYHNHAYASPMGRIAKRSETVLTTISPHPLLYEEVQDQVWPVIPQTIGRSRSCL
jgi:hypothetical protein